MGPALASPSKALVIDMFNFYNQISIEKFSADFEKDFFIKP